MNYVFQIDKNTGLMKQIYGGIKWTVWFWVLILMGSQSIFAQMYQLEKDIPYYEVEHPLFGDVYVKDRCKLDVYHPKNSTPLPVLIWFHGGGLTEGEKFIPEGLLEKNILVVTANYRLSPKVQSPAFIQDAAAAVAWTFNHIEDFGGNPEQIFVSGHSAGGYLASMVGMDKSWLKAFDVDANAIAGLIPLSGHTITHFTIRAERGLKHTQPVVDELAPLYHVRADAPPLLLITGDREMELWGRYEENAFMMRMMKVAGHKDTRIMELDGYDHGMIEPAIPLVLKEIYRVVNQ